MSIQDFLNNCEDRVDLHAPISLNFSVKGFGFGQLYFYQDDNEVIHCSNECMSKERIKSILAQMVDQCILEDEPLRIKDINYE